VSSTYGIRGPTPATSDYAIRKNVQNGTGGGVDHRMRSRLIRRPGTSREAQKSISGGTRDRVHGIMEKTRPTKGTIKTENMLKQARGNYLA